MDERPLEDRFQFADDVVVGDAVAEIPGENLPFDGFVHDEGHVLPHLVGAGNDFVVEFEELGLVVELEKRGAPGLALVFSTVEIGTEKVGGPHGS